MAGPSGVGKTSVVAEALVRLPGHCPARRAVTATSRAPRPGEVSGVDYHYWRPNEFEAHLSRGDMLEHAFVFGADHYGTPRAEVEAHRLSGVAVLSVIDVQGAAQLRSKFRTQLVDVFIRPPGFDELRRRLTARGTETPEKVARRLAAAEVEMARAGEFDTTIINDSLARAAGELAGLVCDQFDLAKGLAMLDDLKEEEIVNKVGGRFKLSTLIQKRMVALNTGAKPLVDLKSSDKMAIVIEEILQDKIYLDQTGEVQTQNMTISMNLPAPYYSGGSNQPTNANPRPVQAQDDDDD